MIAFFTQIDKLNESKVGLECKHLITLLFRTGYTLKEEHDGLHCSKDGFWIGGEIPLCQKNVLKNGNYFLKR